MNEAAKGLLVCGVSFKEFILEVGQEFFFPFFSDPVKDG